MLLAEDDVSPMLDRRGFVQYGGRCLAAAAVAAATPGPVFAQRARRRPQRVAVIGVDHYHATSFPNYLRIPQTLQVATVGVHAPDAATAEFRHLVDAGVPFLMEKPWGTDARTVNELAELARTRNAWAAVPMPFRYRWFAETAAAMREKGELGALSHGSMRFNQPGVQRYRDLGSPWMLSKKDTGGGALIFDAYRRAGER